MGIEQENARAVLAKLENDSKHTTPTDEANKQTKNDDMNDPKNHKEGPVDSRWHKDANGHYTHPDFE